MCRAFAIGDIHGCHKTFSMLVENGIRLKKNDTLFLLGDYIDRGPDSKAVIDYILDLIDKGYDVRPLIGNHEQLLLEAIDSPYYFDTWIKNRGYTTLKNFKVTKPINIEDKYIKFFRKLEYYYTYNNLILVHGGLNFAKDDPFKDKYSMVWERNSYIDMVKTGGKKVICGHSPTAINAVRQSLVKNRITLDSGCVYPEVNGMGFLSALELNTFQLIVQKNVDMV